MAITGPGTTVTKDAASIGCVRSITPPDKTVGKTDITCLDSTIMTYTASTIRGEASLVITRLLDPEVMDLDEGDSGAWVITFPKQTSGSASGMTWTFSGFIESITTSEISTDEGTAIEETITISLTTLITKVDEA